MASINKCILVGNLTRDPETRSFPSGDQICNIRLATNDRWKDKQTGEMREHAEFHSVVFGGKLAEIASQYLRKGSQVYVEGSLRTRKWQDQNGNDRYSTEIRGDTMQMLGSRQGMGGGAASGGGDDGYGGGYGGGQQGGGHRQQVPQARNNPPRQQQEPQRRQSSGFDDMDDDIPF